MMTPAQEERGMSSVAGIAALLLIAGIVVRVLASTTELWHDEIWSLSLLRGVNSPIQIFTAIHHDNNHPINSLFLYLVGEHCDWVTYRLLSITSGIGTILLAALIARRRGRLEALTTVVLFSTSYLMVLYSSEARGYMPAVFFALLAFYAADRYGRSSGLDHPLLFGIAVMLGFLSHLTFLFAYLALMQWMLARRASSAEFLRWHVIPFAFLGMLCLIDVRHLRYGGVYNPIPLVHSIQESASLPLGLPNTYAGMAMAIAFSVFIVASGLRALRRSGNDTWSFYVTALSSPVVVLVAVGVALEIWYPRYAIVSISVFYLLIASVLSDRYRANGWGKVVYAAVLLIFCLGNGWRVINLVQRGRGGYLEALTYMAAKTPGDTIRVAGSHDAAVSTLLSFYAQRIPNKRFVYVSNDTGSSAMPPWFVVTAQEGAEVPNGMLLLSDHAYSLVGTYDCFSPGCRWFVYRNALP